MAIDWIVPLEYDVKLFMASSVVNAVAPIAYDAGDESRVDNVLLKVIARVRGAIRKGKKTPVSLTANSVPPEGEQHTIILAVEALAAVEPQLGRYIETDAFKRQLTAAETWLEAMRTGEEETDYPSDPDGSSDGQQRTLIVEPLVDGGLLTRDHMDGL